MKTVLKTLLTTLIIFTLSYAGFAQENSSKDTSEYPYWAEMMQDPSVNFYQTQRAFNLYWEGKEITKGCGYKPFKRWEDEMKYRINENGDISPIYLEYYAQKSWNESEKLKLEQLGAPSGGNGTNCSKKGYWEEIGPIIYPTNSTSQPTGMGRVNAVAFHPTDSNIMYCGAPAGGLWRTADGGLNWVGLTDQMATLGVSAIIVDPVNPKIIYIGTGDRDKGTTSGLGVFKSTDEGKTFTQSNSGMGNRTVSKMIMDPKNPKIIIAATTSGIYRTTNAGSNWSRTSSLSNFKDLDYKPGDFKTIYAARSGMFYRSQDSGKSFSRITSGLPTSNIYRSVIGVSPDNANYVYVLVTEQRKFIGLYRSTNSGGSFSTRSTTPNIMDQSVDGSGSSGQSYYDLDIAVDPTDANTIYAGGVNVWKSTNGGSGWSIDAHWTGLNNSSEVHGDHHEMEYHPLTGNLIVGNDGGVYVRYAKTNKWKEFSNGLAIGQVYRVGTTPKDKDFIINGYQDNGTSLYTGKGKFNMFTGGDGMDNAVAPNGTYFSSYIYGLIRRHGTSDDGTIAQKGSNGITEDGAWVTPFVLQEGSSNYMIAGYKNIWVTDDLANSSRSSIMWSKKSNNLGGTNSSLIHKVENSPADNKIVYFSREDKKLFKTTNITASTVSWSDLTSNLPNNSRVEDIESHYSNKNIVYIVQNKKVYKSTTGGTSWTDISKGFPTTTKYCIVLDSSKNDGSIYVGTYTGVLYTNDNLSSWVLYSHRLPTNVPVYDLEIVYAENTSEYRLVAATYGRGTWKTQLYDNGISKPIAEFNFSESAICKGNFVTCYNESDYYPDKLTWSVSPSTGVSFIGGTSSASLNPQLQFSSKGQYEVKLIVQNCNGKDSIVKSINVYDKVKSTGCTTTTSNLSNNYGMGIFQVQFNDDHYLKSNGSVVSGAYENKTCDAVIELLPNKQHGLVVYTGRFNNENVKVYIDYNNDGDLVDAGEQIGSSNTKKDHTIFFTIPSSATKGVALRMRVVSDFGSISGPCASLTYGQSEDYSIVVKNDEANFTTNKTSACIGEQVTYTDASNFLGTTFSWDFGAGASPATAKTKGPHKVTYSSSGNKTVKLTVNGSVAKEKTNFVAIQKKPSMSIQFAQGGASNCEGTTVALQAIDNQSLAKSYEWYKGSTKLSEKSNILTLSNFTANEAGSYTVKGINGACEHTSGAVSLSFFAKPKASFTVNDDEQCLKGNKFQFTNTSTGNGNTYKWEYGDGSSSSQTAGNRVYVAGGTYFTSLIATNNLGCKDTAKKLVTVGEITDSNFTVSHKSDRTYTFIPNNQFYTSYSWDFGDKIGTSTQNQPTYYYPQPGSYMAKLTVTYGGCTATSEKTVHATFDAIGEIKGLSDLVITPNPTNGKISISFSLKSAKNIEISLMDAIGRKTELIKNSNYLMGDNNISIDLKDWNVTPGTYFILMTSENSRSTLKIIMNQ